MNISFIIPACNDEKYIGECLCGLSKLKDPEYEFIVIDDGSTDQTGSICDRFERKDSRFLVIHQENRGVSSARNAGLEKACGEWVCFTDGDDLIDAAVFEKEIVQAVSQECEVYCFRYDNLAGGRRVVKPDRTKEAVKYDTPDRIRGLVCSILNGRDFENDSVNGDNYYLPVPWGKLYRRDFLEKHGIRFVPDVVRRQDQLFNFDVFIKTKRVGFIPAHAYIYRCRDKGYRYGFNRKLLNNAAGLTDAFHERLGEGAEEELLYHYYIGLAGYILNLLKVGFCHPDNPDPYRKRKKDCMETMQKHDYAQSLNQVSPRHTGMAKWLLLKCLRSGWFFPVNLYYRKASGLVDRMTGS